MGGLMSEMSDQALVERPARSARGDDQRDGPPRPPRRPMLFADGTGNAFSKQESNVWRLYEALDRTKPDQVAYYIKGVGTAAWAPLAALDGATGIGVPSNVRKLYRFLCWNWRPGDRIYIFGFSRGSFTARTLAALIGSQGLVPAEIDGIPVSHDEMQRNDGSLAPIPRGNRAVAQEPADDLACAPAPRHHPRAVSFHPAPPLLRRGAQGDERSVRRRDRVSRGVRHRGGVRRSDRGAAHCDRLGDLADLVPQSHALAQGQTRAARAIARRRAHHLSSAPVR